MTKRAAKFLFITAIIISYVILAFELTAIQHMIKYLELDDNSSLLMFMMGFVVIFLAIGYYTADGINLKSIGIRDRIIHNFVVSILFIFLGNSHEILERYLETLNYWGINGKMIQSYIFINIFLLTPSYLLAQSIPLIGKYFKKRIHIKNKSNIILLIITLSLVISLFITLFFSCIFSLDYAVIFNIFLITIGILILNKREKVSIFIMCFSLLFMTFTFNNKLIRNKIKENNSKYDVKFVD